MWSGSKGSPKHNCSARRLERPVDNNGAEQFDDGDDGAQAGAFVGLALPDFLVLQLLFLMLASGKHFQSMDTLPVSSLL